MLPALFYWIGIAREASDQPWQYLDGLPVQQLASTSPYAHWSWNTNAYSYDAAKPTWNCVMVGWPAALARHLKQMLPPCGGTPSMSAQRASILPYWALHAPPAPPCATSLHRAAMADTASCRFASPAPSSRPLWMGSCPPAPKRRLART
jgi:hypothetical protein